MATATPETSIAPVYQSRAGIFEQRVTHVEHFTDGLFSFRMTRPPSFRFRSGEFAMIGLPNAARPIFRAYSIASPAWDDELEFYSIKVPNGPFTQNLQHITVGDAILLKKKTTGTLVLDALLPGRRLFLFATGTGIAPFASIVRDSETYEKYDHVVLTHTCRSAAELTWGNNLVANLANDPMVGNLIREDRLLYVTSLTREPHHTNGRITRLIRSGALFDRHQLAQIDPELDRAMVCGSHGLLNDLSAIVEEIGLREGSNARPGTYVVERAFAD
ncbi:MAG: ferredoxin--NADP reductase [Hyphomicrobiaceae bacterium]